MELPASGYFYALAGLSMAFVGFTAIVVVLRQGSGLSPLHVLFTSLFVELGLMATAFAMLAPTLAICGMRENLVWRVSSAIMLAVLVPWLLIYAKRRKPPHRMKDCRFAIISCPFWAQCPSLLLV